MGGTGVVDRFLTVFSQYIDSGFGLLSGEVAFIATTLIVIDVTLAALFWSWGANEDIIARLVKKTLFVGIFAWIIGNWSALAAIVFNSFAGLGLKASGSGLGAADLLRPGRVAQVGIEAAWPLLEAIADLVGYVGFFENFLQIVILLLAWAVVVIAFFILSIQLFVTLIEFKLTTLAGFVLIPFGLFGKTAFLAERVLGNVVSSGVKVLVLAVIIGIGSAPADYSKVPRLGPPLPGDLGKPILDAQDRGAVAELPPVAPGAGSASGTDPRAQARLQLEQERETVRTSSVFTGAGSRSAQPAALPASGLSEAPAATRVNTAPTAAGFLERAPDRRTNSPERLSVGAGDGAILAGSVIPAALITGIRSDQPGLVTAQVTHNVYDSLTGRRLLIPQGARLIGEYEADVGFGQRRVLLAWNRLILPDGRSIVLERQPAADASGYAGLEDRADYHWGSVLKAAFVSTLLGVGGELGASDDGNLVRALRRGSQDSVNRAGEQIVSRELAVRPTLTIRPGYPVRVLVTRDIVMESGS